MREHFGGADETPPEKYAEQLGVVLNDVMRGRRVDSGAFEDFINLTYAPWADRWFNGLEYVIRSLADGFRADDYWTDFVDLGAVSSLIQRSSFHAVSRFASTPWLIAVLPPGRAASSRVRARDKVTRGQIRMAMEVLFLCDLRDALEQRALALYAESENAGADVPRRLTRAHLDRAPRSVTRLVAAQRIIDGLCAEIDAAITLLEMGKQERAGIAVLPSPPQSERFAAAERANSDFIVFDRVAHRARGVQVKTSRNPHGARNYDPALVSMIYVAIDLDGYAYVGSALAGEKVSFPGALSLRFLTISRAPAAQTGADLVSEERFAEYKKMAEEYIPARISRAGAMAHTVARATGVQVDETRKARLQRERAQFTRVAERVGERILADLDTDHTESVG